MIGAAVSEGQGALMTASVLVAFAVGGIAGLIIGGGLVVLIVWLMLNGAI